VRSFSLIAAASRALAGGSGAAVVVAAAPFAGAAFASAAVAVGAAPRDLVRGAGVQARSISATNGEHR
jgi:hypothetical protein